MDFYFLMYNSRSVTICNRLSYTLHHLTQKDKTVSSSKISIISAILTQWNIQDSPNFYLTQQTKVISEETNFVNKTYRNLGIIIVNWAIQQLYFILNELYIISVLVDVSL